MEERIQRPPHCTEGPAFVTGTGVSELYRNAFALPNSLRLLLNTVSNFVITQIFIMKIKRKYRSKGATNMVGRKKNK